MATAMPAATRARDAITATAPDAALADRVRAGDERAFEALYARHADPLFRYCRGIVGTPEDAEEALQNAMLDAYRALRAGARPEVGLRPWLYRIAHNRSLDLLRARRSRATVALTGAEPQSGPGVPERVESGLRLMETTADLAELPVEQRSALVLRELGGLSHRQIGEVLHADPAGVKSLIHQAREGLVGMAAGRDEACGDVRRRLSDGDGRVLRARGVAAHLRACAGCREYRAAVAAGRGRLQVLLPPLPVLVGARILEGVQAGGVAAPGAGVAGAGSGAIGLVALTAGGSGGSAIVGALAAGVATMGVVAIPQVVAGDPARGADPPPARTAAAWPGTAPAALPVTVRTPPPAGPSVAGDPVAPPASAAAPPGSPSAAARPPAATPPSAGTAAPAGAPGAPATGASSPSSPSPPAGAVPPAAGPRSLPVPASPPAARQRPGPEGPGAPVATPSPAPSPATAPSARPAPSPAPVPAPSPPTPSAPTSPPAAAAPAAPAPAPVAPAPAPVAPAPVPVAPSAPVPSAGGPLAAPASAGTGVAPTAAELPAGAGRP